MPKWTIRKRCGNWYIESPCNNAAHTVTVYRSITPYGRGTFEDVIRLLHGLGEPPPRDTIPDCKAYARWPIGNKAMRNRTPAPKKTTAQRGYDHNHKQNRRRLLTRHIDETPCYWCGKPMFKDANKEKNWDGKPLHAHHPEGQPTRTTATELLHDTCNKQCGKPRTRDDLRPALTTPTSPESDPALGHLVLPWP